MPDSNWADVSGVEWVNLVSLLQNQNRPASSAATSDAALCENEFIHSLSPILHGSVNAVS